MMLESIMRHLDPAYVQQDKYYRFRNEHDFHDRLAELLRGGKFTASVNDCQRARKLYEWAGIKNVFGYMCDPSRPLACLWLVGLRP